MKNTRSSLGASSCSSSQSTNANSSSSAADHSIDKPADVCLSFNLQVIVLEARGGLKQLAATRQLYCTMEVEGSDKLQTERVEARRPLWDSQGDFVTQHPLPVLKIKLLAVNASVLSLDDKELGRIIIRPKIVCANLAGVGGSSGHATPMQTGKSAEWYALAAPGSSASVAQAAGAAPMSAQAAARAPDSELRLKLVVRMERPQQLKHCGYLLGTGKCAFRKFKRRYHVLVQASQYNFLLCSYKDKKAKPSEVLSLVGFTVDFVEPPTDLIMEHCTEFASTGTSYGGSIADDSTGASSSAASFGLAGRLASAIRSGSSSQSASMNSVSIGSNSSNDDSTHLSSQEQQQSQQHQAQSSSSSAIKSAAALSDELHSKHYFTLIRENECALFCCDDEHEAASWVMALYRATGQAHKPEPLAQSGSGLFGQPRVLDSKSGDDQRGNADCSTGQGPGSCQVDGKLSNASSANHDLLASLMLPSVASNVSQGRQVSGISGSGNQRVHSAELAAEQKARKHGMHEFISADAFKFNHNYAFRFIQHQMLKYRFEDDNQCSLGWLSPSQVFVLDEYCARYGVRTCFRQLSYLSSLIEFADKHNRCIDYSLLSYAYDFCSQYVSGASSAHLHPLLPGHASYATVFSGGIKQQQQQQQATSVTVEERDLFNCVRGKLLKLLRLHLSDFVLYFPLGKPDGALKAALALLERVLLREQTSARADYNDCVRQLVRKCLEQAALANYRKLSDYRDLSVPPPTFDRLMFRAAREFSSPATGASASNNQQPTSLCSTTSTSSSNSSSSACQFQSTSSSSSSATGTSSSSYTTDVHQSSLPSMTSSGEQAKTAPVAANKPPLTMAAINCGSDTSQVAAIVVAGSPSAPSQAATPVALRPREKLKLLIRLAELCCELCEENCDYYSDALAWYSDLLLEHNELFWSLFTVDVDKILVELQPLEQSIQHHQQQQQQQQQVSSLQQQDPELALSKQVFYLFQVLNSHLRKCPALLCPKFQLYLCDTFKPRLLRHLDVCELHCRRAFLLAFERELRVDAVMLRKLFARLEQLQKFLINELLWPEQVLAEQLSQRVKLIAFELCEQCLQKILACFKAIEKKAGKWSAATSSLVSAASTQFTSAASSSSSSSCSPPTTLTASISTAIDIAQLINLTLETNKKSLTLCTFNNIDQMQYHAKIDRQVEEMLTEMQNGIVAKLLTTLEATLTKLARHDEGSLFAPIMSLTYKQGMSSSGQDIAKAYATFLSSTIDLLHQNLTDELWLLSLFENWYNSQMTTLSDWFNKRIEQNLHTVQLAALTNIVNKIYQQMSLQGLAEDKLSSRTYKLIVNRLKVEESALAAASSTTNELSSSVSFQHNTSTAPVVGSQQSTAASSSSTATGAANFASSLLSTISSTVSSATASSTQAFGFNSTQTNNQQQQQQQQQQQDQQTPQFPQNNNLNQQQQTTTTANSIDGNQNDELNIGDRAIQRASKLIKNFWTTNN